MTDVLPLSTEATQLRPLRLAEASPMNVVMLDLFGERSEAESVGHPFRNASSFKVTEHCLSVSCPASGFDWLGGEQAL